MVILPAILFLICIVLAIYYLFLLHQRYDYFSRRGIPTPKFHFFYGHLKILWNSKFFHRQLESWTKQYGRIYGIYQGTVPIFVVSDPDFLHEVFVKQFNVFDGRWDVFGGASAPSVFTSHGATWRRHRYVINPTFSAAKLKMMSPLINGCISNVTEKLVDHVKNGSEFNIYTYYKRMTMDVICKSSLFSPYSLFSFVFQVDVHLDSILICRTTRIIHISKRWKSCFLVTLEHTVFTDWLNFCQM